MNVVLSIVALFALLTQLLLLGWLQRLVRTQRVSIALLLELNHLLSIAAGDPQKSEVARRIHQEAEEEVTGSPELLSLQTEIDRFVTQSGYDLEEF